MRGLKQDRSARVIIAGHGFVQDLRRGHYELATEEPAGRRVATTFAEQVFSNLIPTCTEPSAHRELAQRDRPGLGCAGLVRWQVKPSGIC